MFPGILFLLIGFSGILVRQIHLLERASRWNVSVLFLANRDKVAHLCHHYLIWARAKQGSGPDLVGSNSKSVVFVLRLASCFPVFLRGVPRKVHVAPIKSRGENAAANSHWRCIESRSFVVFHLADVVVLVLIHHWNIFHKLGRWRPSYFTYLTLPFPKLKIRVRMLRREAHRVSHAKWNI